MKTFSKKGISIIEIIIAASIIAISIVGIVAAIQIYLKIVYQNTRESRAVLALDEGAEALQYMRDMSYTSFFQNASSTVEYSIFWNGTGYSLSTSTVELPYNMTRKVIITPVKRDSNDLIVTSGTTDPNTKKATITIAWPYKNATSTLVAETLIHNTYAN